MSAHDFESVRPKCCTISYPSVAPFTLWSVIVFNGRSIRTRRDQWPSIVKLKQAWMLIWNFNEGGVGGTIVFWREREFNALEALAPTPTSASATFTLFPMHTLFRCVAFSKFSVFLVILKWVFVFLLRNEVWISFIYCFSTIVGLFFNYFACCFFMGFPLNMEVWICMLNPFSLHCAITIQLFGNHRLESKFSISCWILSSSDALKNYISSAEIYNLVVNRSLPFIFLDESNLSIIK